MHRHVNDHAGTVQHAMHSSETLNNVGAGCLPVRVSSIPSPPAGPLLTLERLNFPDVTSYIHAVLFIMTDSSTHAAAMMGTRCDEHWSTVPSCCGGIRCRRHRDNQQRQVGRRASSEQQAVWADAPAAQPAVEPGGHLCWRS